MLWQLTYREKVKKTDNEQQQTLELETTCRPKRYSVLGMSITNDITIHPWAFACLSIRPFLWDDIYSRERKST